MSNEYISVNSLASSVAQKYPDSTTIVIYFDNYYNSHFNRINIIPLKIAYINDRKQIKTIDDLFPEMRYISAPEFIVKNFKRGFAKLLIDANETTKEDEDWTFHKLHIYPVNNKRLHIKLNPSCVEFDRDIINLDIDPDMI